MTDQLGEAHTERPAFSELLEDANRYRRLCWLVEFGQWCVGKTEVVDKFGVTEEEWIDDKAHMDTMLDRPDVVQDAESCQRALSSNVELQPRTE